MHMRNIIFFAILIFVLDSSAEELKEYRCGILYNEAGVEKPQYMEAPQLHLMDYSEERQLVRFASPDGIKVTSIMCDRSSIVPYKYDFMAITAGYVLYIRSPDRTLVLELKDDQFTYRLIEGSPLDKSEKSDVEAMIKYFQSRKVKADKVGHA